MKALKSGQKWLFLIFIEKSYYAQSGTFQLFFKSLP